MNATITGDVNGTLDATVNGTSWDGSLSGDVAGTNATLEGTVTNGTVTNATAFGTVNATFVTDPTNGTAAGNTTGTAVNGTTEMVSPTITYTYDFESGAAADGWTTSTFSLMSGSTGSASTGPQSASTGSYYMYAETSTPNNPYGLFEMYQEFDDSLGTVDFDYHMYGATIGTVEVQGSADGSSYTTLWTKSGEQGSGWSSASVDASGGAWWAR